MCYWLILFFFLVLFRILAERNCIFGLGFLFSLRADRLESYQTLCSADVMSNKARDPYIYLY